MHIEKAIKKYIETVESDVFASYEKDFAYRLTSALSECYQPPRLDETDMVKIVGCVINSFKKNIPIKSSQPYFELSTNAIFIHGYPKKSGVEFDYYGKPAHTELGDIIFIISIIFNGRKYFEKFTINQFKKNAQNRKTVSWNIDNKEQLYLLSRFPKFRGVKGSLVPQKDFNLPNHSGCLGSYGLLYSPGDFAFVSATRLDSYMGSSKKINGEDLFLMHDKRNLTYISEWHHFWHEGIHMMEFCRHFCKPCRDVCFCLFPFHLFLENCHFSINVFDFVSKYLRLCIGEPTDITIGRRNLNAQKFLHELLTSIKIKAERENMHDVLDFINRYFIDNGGKRESREDNVSDFEEDGIGIVHTIINLGE